MTRELVWRCQPFFFPKLVGGEEGKGVVVLVSLVCASTKKWCSNQIAELLIKYIPQPHIYCATFYCHC